MQVSDIKMFLKGSYVASRFKGKKTLDVGCGRGGFLMHDPENFEGLEINEDALRICNEKGYTVHSGNATKLPFKDESFEAIHCRQLIEHLSYQEALEMFREMNRILKKDGEIALATEIPRKEFWDTFTHVRPYSPKSIQKLLSTEGQETFSSLHDLKIEKVFYTGRCFSFKPFTMISFFLANFLGVGRVNYLMILKKRGIE